MWRGGSYLILFFWILGISILFYEKANINYNLIFHSGEHNMPQSKSIFVKAAVLSLLYLILFVLYVMDITGQLPTDFEFFGEVFWAIVLGYVFVPLPFIDNSGRLSFLKLLLKVILSPCGVTTFFIAWVTEQLISFNQPMGDFFYTICYVSRREASWCLKHSSYFSSAYVITMYFYRIIANGKNYHALIHASGERKCNFLAPPFLSIVRSSLSVLTAVISIINRQKVFANSLTLWIVFAAITTVYSFIIDLRGDWGLLNFEKGYILRKNLLFPKAKPIYYIIAVINLAFRTAWILSISPLVINS